jgi:hypothetical protein
MGVVAAHGSTGPTQTPQVSAHTLVDQSVGAVPDSLQAQPAPDAVSGQQAPPETDAVVIRASVFPNGTAVWSQRILMQISSDEEEAEFAAFESEFEQNRSLYLDEHRQLMTGAVASAANATNREMSATGFTAEVGRDAVPRERGFVTYRFRWGGFASVENDTVTVGDVFEGGFFLDQSEILVVEGPEGYEATAVEPAADEADGETLEWNGRDTFDGGRPTAQFVPPEDQPSDGDGSPGDTTDDGSPGDTTDDQTDSSDEGGSLSVPMLFGAGVVLLAGAGAGALYVRRQRQTDDSSPTADNDTTPQPDAGSDDETSAGPDEMPDLATDEDRVLAALEGEGGRMKQSDLADQLDWSASKTSRVLSGMAEEDQVEKLRIGRENVIDLVEGED